MFFEIANAASAAGDIWIDPTKAYAIEDIIRVAIALVVLFSWMLAVFFIIWWWVMLILSGWKEEKTKPAINSIRYSVIWLIVIILSIFLAPKVGDMLWLNVSQYISPNAIFSTIQDLSNKFFWSKDTINIDVDTGQDELPADFSDL
ncbi:MAG: hypothetical protein ACD_3C00237G0006 [uncultured bacterium (gcode 4)]|uniref:Uncharacterized protein n=1 Tax=uncultured bacterium (gcode 4) TaxID=1234023 RepID=K2FW89_9BACT|nr:MAG: hypothetical protein ACD_3C00237G0006 [uncultured bacterium (gcode 4)]